MSEIDATTSQLLYCAATVMQLPAWQDRFRHGHLSSTDEHVMCDMMKRDLRRYGRLGITHWSDPLKEVDVSLRGALVRDRTEVRAVARMLLDTYKIQGIEP